MLSYLVGLFPINMMSVRMWQVDYVNTANISTVATTATGPAAVSSFQLNTKVCEERADEAQYGVECLTSHSGADVRTDRQLAYVLSRRRKLHLAAERTPGVGKAIHIWTLIKENSSRITKEKASPIQPATLAKA